MRAVNQVPVVSLTPPLLTRRVHADTQLPISIRFDNGAAVILCPAAGLHANPLENRQRVVIITQHHLVRPPRSVCLAAAGILVAVQPWVGTQRPGRCGSPAS